MKHAPFEVERQLCLAAFAILTQPKRRSVEDLEDRWRDIEREIHELQQESCGAGRCGGDHDAYIIDCNERLIERLWKEAKGIKSELEDYADGAPDASAEAKHANALLSEMEDV